MSKHYWERHIRRLEQDHCSSVTSLLLISNLKTKPKPRRRFGFVASLSADIKLVEAYVSALIAKICNNSKGEIMDDLSLEKNVDVVIAALDALAPKLHKYKQLRLPELNSPLSSPEKEKYLFEAGLVFLELGCHNDAGLTNDFLEAGFPANFSHPTSRKTLLHLAAQNSAGAVVNTLIKSRKCDYLTKDSKGQTPYDISFKFGRYNGSNEDGLDVASINQHLLEETLEYAETKKQSVEFMYGRG